MYAGGSDGERDRRYKAGRRSKSRDSQFSEPAYGRRQEPNVSARSAHRTSKFQHPKTQFENDFVQEAPPPNPPAKKPDSVKLDLSAKKTATMSRLKKKDSPKLEELNSSTFPRKGTLRAQSMFENDFVPSETDSPQQPGARFNFEISETDVGKHGKSARRATKGSFDIPPVGKMKERKPTSRFPVQQKSLFEDNFSPTAEKPELDDGGGISSIKEENQTEAEDSFSINNFDRMPSSRRSRLAKGRLSAGQLKKSESVNIFARENDPFDDEFFSAQDAAAFMADRERGSPKEIRWTEEFDDFDMRDGK